MGRLKRHRCVVMDRAGELDDKFIQADGSWKKLDLGGVVLMAMKILFVCVRARVCVCTLGDERCVFYWEQMGAGSDPC